jgi:molybdate transport system ATP-binding protein
MALDLHIQERVGDLQIDITLKSQARCMALFGPSGAGKSLCLKAIAGIRHPDSGHIRILGLTLFDAKSGCDLPPQARRMGYVPQGSALFPHLNVRQNIAFAAVDPEAPDRLAERFGIQDLLDRPASVLSGGEAQRVALARALATEPQFLLLDEPFSGVDMGRRIHLIQDLRNTLERDGIPILFVTHELADVLSLADEVALLDKGKVLQSGEVETVLESPNSARSAALLGGSQALSGSLLGRQDTRVLVRSEMLRPLGPKEALHADELLIEGEVLSSRRGPKSQDLQIRLHDGSMLQASLPIWWWRAQSPRPTHIRLGIQSTQLSPLDED